MGGSQQGGRPPFNPSYPPPVDQQMALRPQGGTPPQFNPQQMTGLPPQTGGMATGMAPQMPQGAPNYAALAGGRMPGVGGPVPQAPNVGGGMPNYAQALQGMFGRR